MILISPTSCTRRCFSRSLLPSPWLGKVMLLYRRAGLNLGNPGFCPFLIRLKNALNVFSTRLERLEHSGNSGVPNFRHHESLSTDLPGHNNSGTRSVGVPTFLHRRIVQTACFGQLHPQQLRLGCRGIQPIFERLSHHRPSRSQCIS